MNREVQRLGGEGCAYFFRERCTRAKDPALSAEARCTLLEARRRLGAKTLDRLERIKKLADPGDREVARRHIIQKNMQGVTRLSCPRYVPVMNGSPLCLHQHLSYCLLLMPKCQGRCEHFFRSGAKTEQARQPEYFMKFERHDVFNHT